MEVVVGAAERYATGGDVADVALDVGIDHVLRRYAEVGGGVEELLPAFGPVDRQQAREGLVVMVEAGQARAITSRRAAPAAAAPVRRCR